MAGTVDLTTIIDKAWQDKSLAEIADAPVEALAGVSESGGQLIRQGSVVVCSLPAANRDPRVGRGDDVDLAHASGSHLAFGYGFHRCIGAELARMELNIAFPRLAARFPEMRLATPVDQLDYRALSIVYGVNAVPVDLG